jgi:transcriptional regulator with XRE-family HTH domain
MAMSIAQKHIVRKHIAALIKTTMTERNWKMTDLNKAIGFDADSTSAYSWLNGGMPSAKNKVKLAQALNIPIEEFYPKSSQALIVTTKKSPTITKRIVQPQATNPLTFTVSLDGNARILLDIKLPLEEATELLQALMVYGLKR